MELQALRHREAALEDKLRLSESRYRDFIDNIVDIYYRTDAQGCITFASHAIVDALGYEIDEIVGRRLSSLYADPGDRVSIVAQLEENDGRVTAFEAPLRRKDGDVIWLSTNAHYLRDGNGDITGVEGTARDITDRRNAERALAESELLFRSIVDNAPTPIALKNREGNYLLVNEAFARVRGLSPGDMTGTTADDNMSGEHAKLAMAHHELIIKTLKTITQERDTILPDGTPYQEFITKFPVFDSEGALISVGSVSIDVNELKTIQSDLRLSEQRFRDFAGATSDSFWELDKDLRFSHVTLMRDAVHSSANDIIGKTRWDAAGGDAENDPHWVAHRETMENKEPFRHFEYWVTDKSGKKRCISISGVPVYDSSGDFMGYRGGTIEVTKLKHAESATRAALQEARDADKAKQDFLAHTSHELRTPLNAIMGFAEVMKLEVFGSLGSARYQGYANDIYQSAGHLLALIDDILDLSKIEAGKFNLLFETIDMADVAKIAARELQRAMAAKSIQFSINVDPDAADFRADVKAIRQILTNLLSNAVKFTPEHGEIILSVQCAGPDHVQIVVSDTGVGIPKADLGAVLSPFTQSGDREIARAGGTGLGLPIVQSLSELHGGSLRIESNVGEGTRVHVHLPRNPAQAATPDS